MGSEEPLVDYETDVLETTKTVPPPRPMERLPSVIGSRNNHNNYNRGRGRGRGRGTWRPPYIPRERRSRSRSRSPKRRRSPSLSRKRSRSRSRSPKGRPRSRSCSRSRSPKRGRSPSTSRTLAWPSGMNAETYAAQMAQWHMMMWNQGHAPMANVPMMKRPRSRSPSPAGAPSVSMAPVPPPVTASAAEPLPGSRTVQGEPYAYTLTDHFRFLTYLMHLMHADPTKLVDVFTILREIKKEELLPLLLSQQEKK